MSRLAGRRIVIAGAASGIGKATAELFAREGAALGLLDLDGAGLQRLAAELPGSHYVGQGNATSEADVKRLMAEAEAKLGGIDGLVACVGGVLVKKVEDLTLDEWNFNMALNLTAPFLLNRSAVPAIRRAGGGTIVNISSGSGLSPLPNRSSYCAPKAGLVMFSKALSMEVHDAKIRVNVLCPGLTLTPAVQALYDAAPNREEHHARNIARCPIGRIAEPIEMANACLFLTGTDSSYMTGAVLSVDGGRVMY